MCFYMLYVSCVFVIVVCAARKKWTRSSGLLSRTVRAKKYRPCDVHVIKFHEPGF